jgi:NAD(P)-dependent dehydrogenase (short-subunit alcohol dehydrogenase family)
MAVTLRNFPAQVGADAGRVRHLRGGTIDMGKLSGKRVLITGGNSGIGLATAHLFSKEGARVAITGRDRETLEEARLRLPEAMVLQSDVGDLAQIDQLMTTLGERFGGLDVLFLNAGHAQAAPAALISERDFDRSVAINFKGVFFTLQKALQLLNEGSSVIVNSSISNQVGAPHFSVYAACKAAARSLVQSLGMELVGRGIRVNAVSPGPIDTPGFGRWEVPREVVDTVRQDFTARSPMKRFGTADEVARAVLFLACTDSSYCLGAELVVDGGFSNLL